MLFQDIHNSDFDEWQQFRQAVQSSDMTTATALLEQYKNTYKTLGAQTLNRLFAGIKAVQELSDSTFKADKIQTATSAPDNLTVGQMYFKVRS